jgi:hypothetical protein
MAQLNSVVLSSIVTLGPGSHVAHHGVYLRIHVQLFKPSKVEITAELLQCLIRLSGLMPLAAILRVCHG